MTLPTDDIMLGEAIVVAEAPQVTIRKIQSGIMHPHIELPKELCWKNW